MNSCPVRTTRAQFMNRPPSQITLMVVDTVRWVLVDCVVIAMRNGLGETGGVDEDVETPGRPADLLGQWSHRRGDLEHDVDGAMARPGELRDQLGGALVAPASLGPGISNR